ncbi:MAG: peptidyl-prolyl cis-trans isomerase [Acidobacteria bacterium]|nr:peptidyl-prolyl cis-trans isomerase [Acidobacteriota bacterium]
MTDRYAVFPAVALLAFLAPVQAGAQTQIVEQVLVNVNGDILTKTEFERRQVDLLRTRPELAAVTAESPELQQALNEVTPPLILAAVDELLLIQRGRELGYAMGDEQFESIVTNIRTSNNLLDQEQFEAALTQEGMTMETLRATLERQMLATEAERADVVDKIVVTEAEAQAYYQANREDFTTPAAVTLREIFIEVPVSTLGINVAEDDAARAEAEAIRARLLAGEPFPRLAAELSDGPTSTNGGLIGPIGVEELSESLQALIAKMAVGGLTEALRTPTGYQILKLETRTQTQIRTFEEARADIGTQVGNAKIAGERLKYLDRLRDQATITWRNEDLERAYASALAERRKAMAG